MPRKKRNTEARKAVSLLTRPLGLEGWDRLEPVILAALVSEDPMLLIGPHGTAKSFLLERLAEALGLCYRFYNASLINYDDLVGIPVPTEDQRALRYISTPTAIWDAQVVFVDELNRTKPELQNKLFPIIHERRVQGIRLDKLRYRWAAMNPPPGDDEEDAAAYLGAEPLDPALADRFAFLIEVPVWDGLTDPEKKSVLLDQFRGRHEFPVAIAALIGAAAGIYGEFQRNPPEGLCEYLIALTSVLNQPKPVISARRATMLFRNALSIQAARVALARAADPGCDAAAVDWDTSAHLAVLHGHPGLAQSGHLDRAALLAAHRQAWKIAGLSENDPWKRLLNVAEPIERLALALRLGGALKGADLSQIMADAVAAEANEARRTALALAVYLAVKDRTEIPAGAIELLARDIRRVLVPVELTLRVGPGGADLAREIGQICSGFADPPAHRDAYTRNLLFALMPDGYQGLRPTAIKDYFHELWDRLVGTAYPLGTPVEDAA